MNDCNLVDPRVAVFSESAAVFLGERFLAIVGLFKVIHDVFIVCGLADKEPGPVSDYGFSIVLTLFLFFQMKRKVDARRE